MIFGAHVIVYSKMRRLIAPSSGRSSAFHRRTLATVG